MWSPGNKNTLENSQDRQSATVAGNLSGNITEIRKDDLELMATYRKRYTNLQYGSLCVTATESDFRSVFDVHTDSVRPASDGD